MSSPASEPVIFKRKSKAKSSVQRQRETSPENTVNEASAVSESPSTLVTKIKKRNRPQSRLSFGATDNDEEESTDVFQIKKSNLSRQGSSKGKAKLVANISTPLSTPQSGPTYDAAYLNELKASTPSSRPPPPSDPYDADMSMNIDDSSFIGGIPGIESYESFEAGLEEHQGQHPETIIHSEQSVKSAKDRRDHLRKTGASREEEDFISLSLTRKEDVYQGPHPESRLMREDDDLGEGDDEYAEYTSAQERIALGKNARSREADKRKAAISESLADADDEDEETREWEQEQLRRGALQTSDRSSSRSRKPKPVYKAAPIPPATPVPSLGPALGRLAQQLAQLTTSHAENTASLNSLGQQREEIDVREKELRDLVEKAEEKRAWFDSLKEWLEGVAGFLDEKYPLVENLENEHVSLLKERHEIVSKRRQADDEDDLATIFGALPSENETGVAEMDEFGREVPKPNPASSRAERQIYRSSRHSRRKARQSGRDDDDEGYSTDSSLPPDDSAAYEEAISSLDTRRKAVLSDVRAEEFKDPAKMKWWSSWREKYGDLYVNAWGGLGVVSVWEFWVRLELVGWNPIATLEGLDSFKWFVGLHEYSRPDGGEELGPDGDLVGSMITTAVIPRLCVLIEEGGIVDVYSGKQVKRLVDLADEVETSIEEGSPKFQTLLKAGITLFEREVNATTTLTSKYFSSRSSLPSFNPQAIPCRQRFLFRRIKLLQNLLRWRKRTKEIFGIGVLAQRLVEEGIVGVAEGGWDVGGEIIVRQAAEMLPPELRSLPLKARLNIY